MKDNNDYQVPIDEYFNLRQYDKSIERDQMSIYAKANAIVEKKGDKHLLVGAYTKYMLLLLNKLQKPIKKAPSFEEFRMYILIAKFFYDEWPVIISLLSFLTAESNKSELTDETLKILRHFHAEIQSVFEHRVFAGAWGLQFPVDLNKGKDSLAKLIDKGNF